MLPPDAATVVVLGRLREGVTAGQAATEVRAILQRMEGTAARLPAGGAGGRPSGDSQNRVRVIPLREQMVGEYRPALAALTAATALVLLIACINVAGLLLARGVSRQPMLAVCAALGAGRGRIVRQLLTESMVLSLGGGALGLAAGVVVFRAVPTLVPGDIVRLDEASLDGVVLAFTFGLSMVVGLAFGAVRAGRRGRFGRLRAGAPGDTDPSYGGPALRVAPAVNGHEQERTDEPSSVAASPRAVPGPPCGSGVRTERHGAPHWCQLLRGGIRDRSGSANARRRVHVNSSHL